MAASASAAEPSENALELTNASASLASGRHGSRPSRWSSAAHSPVPVSASAMSASGPRSDCPSEPTVRARGARPAFSAATSRSASDSRTPERPRANPASCASRVARTTAARTAVPVPVRCESSSNRLKSACSSAATETRFMAPTPVVRPYTCEPSASSRSVAARPAAIRSRAGAESSTGRCSSATAATCSSVSLSSSTTF